MITAEILRPCVVCCQPGSVVEVTDTQFRLLGDAARLLPNDAPSETAEAESADAAEAVEETPRKKSGRKKA